VRRICVCSTVRIMYCFLWNLVLQVHDGFRKPECSMTAWNLLTRWITVSCSRTYCALAVASVPWRRTEGVEMKINAFLTSCPDQGESISCSGHFILGWVSEMLWWRQKLLSPSGIEPLRSNHFIHWDDLARDTAVHTSLGSLVCLVVKTEFWRELLQDRIE